MTQAYGHQNEGQHLCVHLGVPNTDYKVPHIIQDEAFALLLRGLEPRIRKQIGYHVCRVMAIFKKANVWRAQGGGNEKEQKQQKAESSGQ